MKVLVIWSIRLYKGLISPSLRLVFPTGCCRYEASCSEYTIRSIEKYGVVGGLAKGFVRVLSCNPLTTGRVGAGLK